QVFYQQEHGLIETFAHQQPRDRLKGAATAHLRVDLRQRGGRLGDAQQGREVGQRVLQAAIQRQHLARDLLAPPPVIILGGELEVVVEQFDQWEIRVRLAVRNGKSLQHQALALAAQLEFVAQA